MDLTPFRLIASDLDGTLVKSGSHNISPSVKKVIENLASQGIQFTIATGRSWREAKPIAEELNITTPVILESGAIILDPITGTVLKMQGLQRELFNRIDSIPLNPGVDSFRISISGIFYYEHVSTYFGQRLTMKRECKLFQRAEEKPEEFIKVLFVGPTELMQNLVVEYSRKVQPVPYMVLWPTEPNGESFLEVFDPHVSKGQALKWLVNRLNISLSQVLAFGDGYNDLDMLEIAGLGVTIDGASTELISRADMIIPGPQDDGVARFLSGEFRKAI